MLKKIIFLAVLCLLFQKASFAWLTPRPSSSFIASQDILPTSSDSHSVGVSGNFFRNGYFRNVYLPYRAESPSVIASMGVVYASTDGNLYFKNAAGSNEKITSL